MSENEQTEQLLDNESITTTTEPKKQRRIKVLKAKNNQNGEQTIPDDTQQQSTPSTLEGPPDEPKMTMWQALRQPENKDTKQTLSKTTAIMVIIPLTVFYLCRHVIFASVSLGGTYTDNASLTYSGIAAVITVNIISFGFVYYATCIERDERLDPVWLDEEVNKLKEEQRVRLAYDVRKEIPKMPTVPTKEELLAQYPQFDGNGGIKDANTNITNNNIDDNNDNDNNESKRSNTTTSNNNNNNNNDEDSTTLTQRNTRRGKSPTRKQ